jgi:hypothetical protein
MLPGGSMSPGYIGQASAAKGWGEAGPQLYVKNNEPYTLRPGAIRGGPNGQIASAPVQVDAVDPATGRTYKTWAYPPMPGAQPGMQPGMPGSPAAPPMPGMRLPGVPSFGA